MEEEQKKLKNINGTFNILFHENVYLLSSPKHKHDVMLMMQLSSCLQKKKHTKIMDLHCKSSRQFFFLLPLLPHFFLYRTPIYLHF